MAVGIADVGPDLASVILRSRSLCENAPARSAKEGLSRSVSSVRVGFGPDDALEPRDDTPIPRIDRGRVPSAIADWACHCPTADRQPIQGGASIKARPV